MEQLKHIYRWLMSDYLKECPKCHWLSPVDGYCSQCGEKYVNLPRCECGRFITRYQKYCPGCGKSREEGRSNVIS